MTTITREPKVMTRSEFIEFVKECSETTEFKVSLSGESAEIKVLIRETVNSPDTFEAYTNPQIE